MNITLNLATRPYIELRPVYARLRIASGALLLLALPLLLLLHAEQTKARAAQARVAQLENNIALLREQQARARLLAREGPNASVLTESAFLNDLFRRKAFSWTATMSDLEGTLPSGVQVQAIDPVVAPDGHVTIRMRVSSSDRARAVEVVRNLEHSRHFVAPRLTGEALANQGTGAQGAGQNAQARPVSAPGAAASGANDVSFDILADYRPLPNSHDQAGVRALEHTAARAVTAPAPTPMAEVTNPTVETAPAPPTPTPRKHGPVDTRTSPYPSGPLTGVPVRPVAR